MPNVKSSVVILSLVLVVAVVLLTSGCPKPLIPTGTSRGSGAVPIGEPIKVGAIFSVTGQAGAPLGTPEKETALMVEKMINAAGGLKGRPLKIIVEDDQSEPTQAVSAAKRLIENEKVVAVIGPTLRDTTMAVVDTFEKAGVPLLSCAAFVKITQPVKQWVFSTAQPDVLAVAALMEYLKSQKTTKVAVIYDSNPFGKSGMTVLDQQAPAAGITIVARETFESKDADMTTQLTKMKGKSPQAVICWGTNPGPALVAKNMKQLKFEVPLLMSHGIANRKFIELAAEAAEGVVFPAGKLLIAAALPDTDPQKKVLSGYAKAFEAEYGKPADTFGGHAWDAAQILIKALASVGDDRAALREALEGTKGFVGISGVFNLSPTEHNGLAPDAFVMVTIKGGQWVQVQ